MKYKQYGPMLDGGGHVYVKTIEAKTSRGAVGQIKRETKEAFNNDSEYRIEILSVEKV